MLTWPFTAAGTLSVQGYGFFMTLAGLVLTVLGFGFTMVQLHRTRKATVAVQGELTRVKASLDKYDAANETSKAESALGYVRKHLRERAWSSVAESYEEFISSVHVLRELALPEAREFDERIENAQQYAVRLCERIEEAPHNALKDQDVSKALTALREHAQLIVSIRIALQRSAIK